MAFDSFIRVIKQASDHTHRFLSCMETLSGNTNEVGSVEDLVFALRNNILKANRLAVA